MSLPVLIGFAGVLVAAVATGMLAGRCVRQPQIAFVVWTAATLGLTIALAAQSMGFASGFGSATFRVIQLFALLLAPLWLAWGLVELIVPGEGARFGMRLISSALTVVASVILATDPLGAQPFGKAWPLTGPHFQPIASFALDAVQVVAVLAVLASAVLAGSGMASKGLARGRAMTTVVPVGLAALMTAGLRFPLPARAAYPLLSMLAAALVWFGASRVGDLPRQAASRGGRRGGVRDREGRYRPDDGYRPDEPHGRAGDYGPDGQYATYVQRGGPRGPQPGPNRYRGSGPGAPAPDERLPGPQADAQAGPGGPAAAPARPYGRILIFTLLEDRVADFDRLAEQAAEEVRTGEPDTLVYVIHLVPNAPLQRIFYEIYRDRAAFDSHENQPYMQRFVAERRSCVLATNVIELRLKYAKVAPLPAARPPRPYPPRYDQPRPDQPRPDQRRPERSDQRQVPSAGRRHGGG